MAGPGIVWLRRNATKIPAAVIVQYQRTMLSVWMNIPPDRFSRSVSSICARVEKVHDLCRVTRKSEIWGPNYSFARRADSPDVTES
jgi:hypothetical protein